MQSDRQSRVALANKKERPCGFLTTEVFAAPDRRVDRSFDRCSTGLIIAGKRAPAYFLR
jgi:hypothetical protein